MCSSVMKTLGKGGSLGGVVDQKSAPAYIDKMESRDGSGLFFKQTIEGKSSVTVKRF